MKHTIKNLLLIAAAVMTTACEMDKLSTPSGNEKQEMGYLRIGEVATNADTENSELNDGTPVNSRAASRAVTAAPDSYYLEIVSVASNEAVWTGTIAQLNALDNAQVGVEPGKYVVYAYQDSNKAPAAGAAVDGTYYAGYSEEVEVKTKEASTFRVTCKLANIKATVELSADLKAMFKKDDATSPLQTVVKVGAGEETNAYTYAYTATHAAPMVYFKDVAGENSLAGNTLTFTLTGIYYTGDPVDVIDPNNAANIDNSKWKEVKMEKTLTNVRAAQWRKISIDIDHNTTGDVQFVINIESLIYDEEIEVDITTLYASATDLGLDQEEAIPDDEEDPAAPDVTIDGQSDLNFSINSSIYDADAMSWTKYLKVNITPKDETTVKQIYAEIISEDASINAGLASILNKDGRIDVFPNKDAVSTYVNVADDGTKVSFKPAGMDALYRHNGTHTIKVYTVDSKNRMKSTDLTITVTSSTAPVVGPTIQWLANGAPASTLVLDNSPATCEASISTTTGLTGLSVDIDSDILTPEELGTLGLAAQMDLFNPASALMENTLRSFGFLPIDTTAFPEGTSIADMAKGDDQYRVFDPATGERKQGAVSPLMGEKEVNFNITSFLSMLGGLENPDNAQYKSTSTFKVIASDEDGTNSAPMTINVAR